MSAVQVLRDEQEILKEVLLMVFVFIYGVTEFNRLVDNKIMVDFAKLDL